MKQHITVEQVKELKVEVIIETFFKNSPNKDNMIKNYLNTRKKSDIWFDWVSREITIGKMIEILYKYDCDIEIISSGKIWYVGVAVHINTESEELVDTLWKCCTYVLTNQ